MRLDEWTDLDYAQAAIDMLPGSVEEIEEWMKMHGIKNTYNHPRTKNCPIAQWVNKWTGGGWIGVFEYAEPFRGDGDRVRYPRIIIEYVNHADRTRTP